MYPVFLKKLGAGRLTAFLKRLIHSFIARIQEAISSLFGLRYNPRAVSEVW